MAALLEAAQRLSRLGRDAAAASDDVPSAAAQTCKVLRLWGRCQGAGGGWSHQRAGRSACVEVLDDGSPHCIVKSAKHPRSRPCRGMSAGPPDCVALKRRSWRQRCRETRHGTPSRPAAGRVSCCCCWTASAADRVRAYAVVFTNYSITCVRPQKRRDWLRVVQAARRWQPRPRMLQRQPQPATRTTSAWCVAFFFSRPPVFPTTHFLYFV